MSKMHLGLFLKKGCRLAENTTFEDTKKKPEESRTLAETGSGTQKTVRTLLDKTS